MKKNSLFLAIIFFLSCSSSNNPNNEALNSVISIGKEGDIIFENYQKNDDLYGLTFKYGEQEFFEIQDIFYQTVSTLEKIETLIYDPSNNFSSIHLVFIDSLILNLYEIGFALTEANFDNNYDDEYQIFFYDYNFFARKTLPHELLVVLS